MKGFPQQITDRFNRVHDYLRISLTERCNLRCFYCMPPEGIQLKPKEHFMKTEEVLEIAQNFVDLGVKKIRLTGGEPLVRKDAKAIIEGLSKLPVELAITTNGIVVDRFVETFKNAGIKAVNLSLDSLQKEKFNKITRRDYFDRVMNNIHLLLRENFHVKINVVLMKNVNDDEAIRFIEWTKNLPLHVRFIEFMPFDGNKWNWNKGVSFKELMEKVDQRYRSPLLDPVLKIQGQKNDTAKNYRIKGYKGTFGVISSVTNPFCDTCNRMRLTADGKMKNCLFSNSETDILTNFRAGKNIKPLILASVWKKKKMRGGMNSFEDFSDPDKNQENRSMVSIGG